ncbi:MAG: HAD family hydrolase [Acidobacteriota bacterium]
MIAFDLFGTLVELGERNLHREVPRLLGVPGRRWVELVREHLLTTRFSDLESFAAFVCRELAAGCGDRLRDECARLIAREADSAFVFDGVWSLLRFLKDRGFRLAVLSNVSSVHGEIVRRSGLDAWLDAAVFSCDEGRCKPDPEFYRSLCRRLEVGPEQILVVGDSLPNDVEAPRAAGMLSRGVGSRAGGDALGSVAEVGLLRLGGDAPLSRLFAVGESFRLGEDLVRVSSLRPLSDGEQGRHNLVFAGEVVSAGGGHGGRPLRVFVKRYLEPASAFVEELAYRVQGIAGLPTCGTAIVDHGEPILVVEAARGEKYTGDASPPVAREIGRHFAFGYVFANADLQPRNAVLGWEHGMPRLTMVDMEHCFLNLAVRPQDLERAADPDAIDELGYEALARLASRRVLNERTLPRFRAAFLDRRTAPRAALEAFGSGFLAAYAELQRRQSEISRLIDARLGRRPPLLIGTTAYRRAMARADLADIGSRLAEDPAEVLARLLAGPC